MSEILEHYSLKTRNTFGLDVTSRYFFETKEYSGLLAFFKEGLKAGSRFMIMGEGSNVLFTGNYEGTIILPALRGIEIISEDKNIVRVRAMSGENWDEFVGYCVGNNWSGLENLSLIPGSVGSSPVQNIGAYGVEAKDRIYEVEGFFTGTCKQKTFSNHDCRFAYRDSIFKQELKNKFVITSVTFDLDKIPKFELGYGPVRGEFMKKPLQDLSALRQTIIEIRQGKLPDPLKIGNAGSFFKNPVIPDSDWRILRDRFPQILSYPSGPGHYKIPAAWLIEQAGWKGVREGNTGTYPSQPLVIVNYGGATGKEVLDFAGKIVESVRKIFGISLEMEVNVV